MEEHTSWPSSVGAPPRRAAAKSLSAAEHQRVLVLGGEEMHYGDDAPSSLISSPALEQSTGVEEMHHEDEDNPCSSLIGFPFNDLLPLDDDRRYFHQHHQQQGGGQSNKNKSRSAIDYEPRKEGLENDRGDEPVPFLKNLLLEPRPIEAMVEEPTNLSWLRTSTSYEDGSTISVKSKS